MKRSGKTSIRLLLVSVITIGVTFLSCDEGMAHWWDTHRYMIDHACSAFRNDGKGQYCDFLERADYGDTYLELLGQGVVDADLRVADIYAVDWHCTDPDKTKNCPSEKRVYNDIPEVIVGDHGYNPSTQKGFSAARKKLKRVEEDWAGWVKEWKNREEKPGRKLLDALEGTTPDQKKSYLLGLMKTRNATHLASFFYERALEEWENSHPVDAFYNLGIALHAVQDLTVPAHSRLTEGKSHENFEKYVWNTYLREHGDNLVFSGHYADLTPEGWVKLTAGQSYEWDPKKLRGTAEKSVALGVAASAGFLEKFFKDAGIFDGTYSEDFNDGQAQGWTSDYAEDWKVVNKEYRAYFSSPSETISMVSTYGGSVYADFSYDVVVRKEGDDAAYMVFRATSDFDALPTRQGSGYAFGIDDGFYFVYKIVNGEFTMIQGWTYSEYIKPDNEWNNMKVIAQGSQFRLYMNGYLIYEFSDTSISNGRIGLLGYTEPDGVTAHYFDNVKAAVDVLDGEGPLLHEETISPRQQGYNNAPVGGSPEKVSPLE